MPIYEYQCSKCGVLEVTQRITEDPLKKCPACQSKVRKLISNTSFQLKGTGWYITDYGRGKGANGNKDGSDSAADSGNDAGKSAEKKTEGKASEKSSSGDSAASTASQ